MSISRRWLTLGELHRMVAAGTLGCLALGAGLALLSTIGCGEKSLPAATYIQTPPAPSGSVDAKPAAASAAAPVAPAKTVARRQYVRNITFDTVKLNMNKGDNFRPELLTPQIKKLDGAKVRIRGFILPPPQQTGLSRFVLVRDNMACCFGPGAALYDSMIVQMEPGLTMDYTVQPVMVEGTFNIHEVRMPNGRCMSIYHVTADKAQ